MILWVLYVCAIVQGYNYSHNCMYVSGINTNIIVSIFICKHLNEISKRRVLCRS